MGGAADVLAGVLDIDGQAGEFLEEEAADDAGVTAGAAGRDEQAVLAGERVQGGREGFFVEASAAGEGCEGFGQGCGLLVDLAQHGVRIGSGHVDSWVQDI